VEEAAADGVLKVVADIVLDAAADGVLEVIADRVLEVVADRVLEAAADGVLEVVADRVLEVVVDRVLEAAADGVLEVVADRVLDAAADEVLETVADRVLEAAADGVLEEAPDGALEDEEADGDVEELELELELFVDDPGRVALIELLDEESDKDDETEELPVDDGTELVERPEIVADEVLEAAADGVLEAAADGVLEGEETDDDVEELELFVDDPSRVALLELLDGESDKDDETEELLVDDGTELVERPEVPADEVLEAAADGVEEAAADGVLEAAADGVEEVAADGVEEVAADGVLEDEDEGKAKMVLDVTPRLLKDEADDDSEELELELFVDDPGRVALMEPLDKESDKDDETEELLVDDGAELAERPKLVELLLEARPLLLKLSALLDKSELLEVTELLELFGPAELLAKLRDEDNELDGDAIKLLLVDVGTELVLEPAAEAGIEVDVLEILGENGEEVCDPVDGVVRDEGDEEIVDGMGNDVE